MKLKTIAKASLISLATLTAIGSAQAKEPTEGWAMVGRQSGVDGIGARRPASEPIDYDDMDVMISSDSRAPVTARSQAEYMAVSGDNEVRHGNAKAAIALYTNAITQDPSYDRVNSKQEYYFLFAANKPKLLAKYNKILKKTPNDPYALAVRGEIKFSLNDIEGAEADFKKSLAYKPDLLFSHLRLAEVGLTERSPELTIAYCQQALHHFPDNARIHCNLGLAYEEHGNHETAISEYDKAIELDPHFSRSYLNRAVALSKLNEFAAEFSDISTCLNLEPDLAVAHSFSAFEHARFKQHMEAQAAEYAESNRATVYCPYQQKHSQSKGNLLTLLLPLTLLLAALIPRHLRKPLVFHE